VLLAVCAALSACVPEGPPTSNGSAKGTAAAAPPTAPPPAVRATAAVAAASASAASSATDAAASPTVAAVAARPPITAVWEDTFDRAEIGPDWNVLGPAWKIQSGRLCARGARNKGAWLLRRLPVNARIEFDAFAESSDGDLKVELWGDGATGATAQSYTNATSYIAILGGWKNTKHVLARLNEHGEDRLEIDVDPHSDDERMRAVSPGQAYHFKVERADGKTVQVSVNGAVYFDLVDKEPLAGPGHEHLGFNDWDAPVCFDNLKVTPL